MSGYRYHYFVINGVSREETMNAARRSAVLAGEAVRVHDHKHGEECNDQCVTVDGSDQ